MVGSCHADDLLVTLRERVRQIEQPRLSAHDVIPCGIAAIDRVLPGGGLARGCLHEIFGAAGDEEDGAGAAAFIAQIAARFAPAAANGIVLWCLSRPDLYGPGLAAHGLDPARLVLAGAARDTEILWAMEEGLRASGVAAVVGEIGTLPDVASRRLQLAAERSGITAFALRRWRNGGQAARERNLPNAAVTRWRIKPLPSRPIPILPPARRYLNSPLLVFRQPRARGCKEIPGTDKSVVPAQAGTQGQEIEIPGFPLLQERRRKRASIDGSELDHSLASGDDELAGTASAAPAPRLRRGDGYESGNRGTYGAEPGIGHPRWRIELLRCRGGAPACWEVEIREGVMTDATDPVSLAEELADRPAPPGGRDVFTQAKLRHTG